MSDPCGRQQVRVLRRVCRTGGWRSYDARMAASVFAGRNRRRCVLRGALGITLALSMSLAVMTPAGAKVQPLSRWAKRYGKSVTRVTKDVLTLEQHPSVSSCKDLSRAISSARRDRLPPRDKAEWGRTLSDLRVASRSCTHDHLASKMWTAGGRALGRFIHYLATHHILLGLKLEVMLLGAASKTKTSSPKKPSPPTTTSLPTTTSPPTPSGGYIGSSFTVTSFSGKYSVRLVQLIDPASGATPTFTTPTAEDRFVAAVFTVTNTGFSQISDDANSDASVIGTNRQDYSAGFNSVAGCTNFNSGEFQLVPGGSETGCVVFTVPIGVSVAKVQWSPTGGFGTTFVQWSV